MKTFRSVALPLITVLFLTVLTPPGSAVAAVAGTPITCGMVLHQDAKLYLARNLTCPTFGVVVEHDPDDPVVPTLEVDLRGHTLRGPGTGVGITAGSGWDGITAQVRNGRLEGWGTALTGGSGAQGGSIQIRNVVFTHNEVGLECSGVCYLDRSYITRSSRAGVDVIRESSAVVTRTVFARNKIGAQMGTPYTFRASDSAFLGNDVGVQANYAQVTVSRSLFVKNRIGVLVTGYVPDWPDGDLLPCAALTKVRFVRNGTNLDGPRC